MAITAEQVAQAQAACIGIEQAAQSVLNYVGQVSSLLQDNWIQSVTLAGATVNADFSGPIEQAAITAQYATLKSAIVDAYNLMP